MKTQTPKQLPINENWPNETLADQLKKKKAKDIQPLEKIIFQVCLWTPIDKNKPTHISNVERAHLRTQQLLKHLTFKLLCKQAFFNLKNSVREKFLRKRKA